MQDINLAGEFWLPENKEERFAGILTFNRQQGLKLKLWGTAWAEGLINLRGGYKNGSVKLSGEIALPLLVGKLENNSKVKLFDLKADVFHNWVVDFSSTYALIGRRLLEDQEPEFKRLLLNYEQLENWIDIVTIRSDLKAEVSSTEYLHEEQVIIVKGHKIRLFTMPSSTSEYHKFHLEQNPYIEIILEKPLGFEATVSLLAHLRRFFSFASGLPLHTKEIATTGSQKTDQDEQISLILHTTELVYRELGTDSPDTRSKNFVAFKYSDVRDYLPRYLAKWFELEEKLEPALTLYLTHTYRPNMYIDAIFLSMAQAIEPLHKRLYFIKDISIRQRLQMIGDLLKSYQSVMDNWFPDYAAFINRVGASRNYYTHYPEPTPENLKDVARSGEDLHELANRIKVLLQLVVMYALEFSAEVVSEIMEYKPEAGYLKPRKSKPPTPENIE